MKPELRYRGETVPNVICFSDLSNGDLFVYDSDKNLSKQAVMLKIDYNSAMRVDDGYSILCTGNAVVRHVKATLTYHIV